MQNLIIFVSPTQPYRLCPEKRQCRKRNKNSVKENLRLNSEHRVHWEDHVLQENRLKEKSQLPGEDKNETFNKISESRLSNRLRENKPPPRHRKRSETNTEEFHRVYNVLWSNNKLKEDISSESISPIKARKSRYIIWYLLFS